MHAKNISYVIIFLVLIAAIMGIAYVYGPSSTDLSADEGTEGPNNVILITHETLTWKNTTIKQGTNVTWINHDFAVDHQIVGGSDGFTFKSGVLKNGESYSVVFSNVGTFNYHDALNPSLSGTINVEA